MSAVDLPHQRVPTGHDDTDGREQRGRPAPGEVVRRLSRSSAVWSVLVCIVLGAVSAAVLPTIPSYDPWSWIVWGREISDPHLNFVISGGPSWKPLPLVFTTIWGLFGGAAPTLWVITARIGGLLGLVAAWRLAYRLTAGTPDQRGGRIPAVVAAIVAVIGILLTQDWFYYFLHGTSETVLIGCTLWIVDRLIEGKRIQAFVLMVCATWIRPEWLPLEGLYIVWLLWREPAYRRPAWLALFALGLISFPIAWFVPPWIGSGNPFLASQHAALYNGNLGPHPFIAVNSRGVNDQVLPILAFGIAGVVIGWLRDRRLLVLGLGLGVILYYVIVVVETMKGYPGLERFFLPAASVVCVLGGYGLVRIAQLAGELISRWADGSGAAVAASVVVFVVLAGASVPFLTTRISDARADFPQASLVVKVSNQLTKVAAAVGGRDKAEPCPTSFVAINHSVQPMMAWKLRVDLERVGTQMSYPGLEFVAPPGVGAATGGPPRIDPRLTRHQLLQTVAGWQVIRWTTPGLPTGCDGY
jgi:hypothetical protein